MIRVLIVDDHPLARAGVRAFLAEIRDMRVVGEAGDVETAIDLVRETAPTVVLMDIWLPGRGGAATIRAVAQATPDVKILVVTFSAEHDRVLAAVDAGAIGYLLKTADRDELTRGIRSAARGESPLAPEAAAALVADRMQRQEPPPELTAREHQVLSLVGRGLTNRQIASQLRISEKTVKAHLGRTFQRIGVRDRTQAALWVRERGHDPERINGGAGLQRKVHRS